MDEIAQYYVPAISDVRGGYICERNRGTTVDNEGQFAEFWEIVIVGISGIDFLGLKTCIEEGSVRTKYLTIDDLERAGWELEGKIEPPPNEQNKETVLYKFSKGKYHMIYDFIARVVMIFITMGDIYSVCVQRFDCPSMNEFLYIESHLNLH